MKIEVKIELQISDGTLKEIQKQIDTQALKVVQDKDYIESIVKKHAEEIIEMQLVSFLEEFDVWEYNDHMAETKDSMYDMIKPYIKTWMVENAKEFKESITLKIQDGMEDVVSDVLER